MPTKRITYKHETPLSLLFCYDWGHSCLVVVGVLHLLSKEKLFERYLLTLYLSCPHMELNILLIENNSLSIILIVLFISVILPKHPSQRRACHQVRKKYAANTFSDHMALLRAFQVTFQILALMFNGSIVIISMHVTLLPKLPLDVIQLNCG